MGEQLEIKGRKEVKKLIGVKEKPEKLEKTLADHREELTNGVQKGQDELNKANEKLSSPEAKNYLSSSAAKLSEILTDLANRGFEIIGKGSKKNLITEGEYAQVDTLAHGLGTGLGVLAPEIDRFQKLQESEDAYKKVIADNEKFVRNKGNNSVDAYIAAYQGSISAIEKGKALLPASISNAEGEVLRKALSEKYDSLKRQFEDDVRNLNKAQDSFRITQSKTGSVAEKVNWFSTLVSDYPKNPSAEKARQIQALERELGNMDDYEKMITAGDMHVSEGYAVNLLYLNLHQNVFLPAKEKYVKAVKENPLKGQKVEQSKELEEKTVIVEGLIAEGDRKTTIVKTIEINIRQTPPLSTTAEYEDALNAALHEYAAAQKIINNLSEASAGPFKAEQTKIIHDKMAYVRDGRIIFAQKQVAARYPAYVSIVEHTGKLAKTEIVYTEAFKSRPKEEQLLIKAELFAAGLHVADQLDSATCPQIMENYWVAKTLFEKGDFENANKVIKIFLDKDINSDAFRDNKEIKGKEREYISTAREILSKTGELVGGNKDFFEAQKMAASGRLIEAKKLLKKYIAEKGAAKEGEVNFIAAAKLLLKRFALTQVADVEEKFKTIKAPEEILFDEDGNQLGKNHEYVVFIQYQEVLKQVRTAIDSGQYDDFTDAYNALGKSQSAKFDVNNLYPEYNFMADEANLDNGKEGLLANARKYRSLYKRGLGDNPTWLKLAEQSFMQYFSGNLTEISSKKLSYEEFVARFKDKPEIFIKIQAKVKELMSGGLKRAYEEAVEKERQKLQALAISQNQSPETVDVQIERFKQGHPMPTEANVTTYVLHQLYSEMLPSLAISEQQKMFKDNPDCFGNPEERGAWEEFANMKGIHLEGTWAEPLGMSDAEMMAKINNLPIDIALIMISSGIGSIVGEAVSGAIINATAEEIATNLIVRSGERQFLAYLAGMVAESAVFTVSHAVLQGIRSGRFNLNTVELLKETGKNIALFGVLGASARTAQALELGKISSFALECSTMGTLNGRFTKDDLAFLLGLKGGHAIAGAITGAIRDTGEETEQAKQFQEEIEKQEREYIEPPREGEAYKVAGKVVSPGFAGETEAPGKPAAPAEAPPEITVSETTLEPDEMRQLANEEMIEDYDMAAYNPRAKGPRKKGSSKILPETEAEEAPAPQKFSEADRAFIRECDAKLDEGGETFLRWKETLEDPHEFALAERVQAQDRKNRIRKVVETLQSCRTWEDYDKAIEETNAAHVILPGAEWAIIKEINLGDKAIVLAPDGQLHLINNSPSFYDYGKMSWGLKDVIRSWDQMTPEARAGAISDQCNLIRSYMENNEIPAEEADRIISEIDPAVKEVILDPTGERINALTPDQYSQLGRTVLKLRNEGFKTERGRARDKAEATIELTTSIEQDLRKQLQGNPDLTREELRGALDLENNPLFRDAGFSDMEKLKFQFAIESLFEKAKSINNFYNRYKDNPRALYREVFGSDPVGPVNIGRTPFSLYFQIGDARDFARASGDSVSDITTGKNSGLQGYSLSRSNVPALEGLITVIRYDKYVDSSIDEWETVRHEEQHNVKRFIFDALQPQVMKRKGIVLDPDAPAETQLAGLYRYLDETQSRNLARAKDELLARVTGSYEDYKDAKASLMEQGGFYDFWSWDVDSLEGRLERMGADPEVIEKAVQRARKLHETYYQVLDTSLDAAKEIDNPAMLMITDVQQWKYLKPTKERSEREPATPTQQQSPVRGRRSGRNDQQDLAAYIPAARPAEEQVIPDEEPVEPASEEKMSPEPVAAEKQKANKIALGEIQPGGTVRLMYEVKNEDGETVQVPVDYQVVKVETSGGIIRQKKVKYTIQNTIDFTTETVTAEALEARMGATPEMTGGSYRTAGQGEKTREMLDDLKKAMEEAREACGKDAKMADKFAEVARAQGAEAVRALSDSRIMENAMKNRKVFEAFAEVAEAQGADAVRALEHATGHVFVGGEFVSGRFDRDEMFGKYVEVAKAQGADTVEALSHALGPLDAKTTPVLLSVAKSDGAEAVRALGDAIRLCPDRWGESREKYESGKMFDRFYDIYKNKGLEALKSVIDAYTPFSQDSQRARYREWELGQKMDRLVDVNKPEDRAEIFNTFIETGLVNGPKAVEALSEITKYLGKDMDEFRFYADIAKSKENIVNADRRIADLPLDALEALSQALSYSEGNYDLINRYLSSYQSNGAKGMLKLLEIDKEYGYKESRGI